MKLSARLPASVAILVLGLAGFVFWIMNAGVVRDLSEIKNLKSRLSEQDRKELDLSAKLRQAKAERAAGEAAARAAAMLDSFYRDKKTELCDPALHAELSAGSDGWSAVAASLMKNSNQPLDQVLVCDTRGLVVAVAPPNDKLLGTGGLKPEDLKLMRTAKRPDPRFEQDILAGGQARSLTVSVSFRGGPKRAFMGAVLIHTAFDNLLKDAAGPASADGDVRVLVVDRRDDIVYAPSPELVGKPIKDTEFAALLTAREGEGTEVVYNLSRWLAVRRTAPLGMRAIGMISLGAPSVAAMGGDEGPRQAPPYLFVVLAMVVVTALILLLVVMPLGRLKSLARAASALASGATAVEFKKAGAKDEIGETMRAVAKLGEMLAEERRHREETGNAFTQVQRDLTRVQAEARELGERQKELEARTKKEKESLEGELQGVRTELDGARAEIEEARALVGVRDTAISERDAIINELNSRIQRMTGDLDGIRQAMDKQTTELSEARHELERRAAVPIASFILLSEAADALAGELSGLLDHVQGYVGDIIETAGGAISDEQQEFLTTVINRSARSQRYLSDIRDFSNISKPGGLAMEPVDMVALLTDVVGTVQQAAEDKGVEFVVDLPASIPEARGDEMRLRQLFMVILQTAMRFTPEGGKVSLLTGMKGDIAGFRIEDGADPIPFSSDEVFGHFHTTEEEALELRGSGLRYPILRAIAEAHGGAIDLAINERGGNLFFVRLPVRATAPTAEMTASLFGAPAAPEPADAPVPAEPPAPETAVPEVVIDATAPGLEAVMGITGEIGPEDQPGALLSAMPMSPEEPIPAPEVPGTAPDAMPVVPDLSALSDLFAAPNPDLAAVPPPGEEVDLAAPPDAPSGVSFQVPSLETTDSILAAPPESPDLSVTTEPPSLDAIETALPESDASGAGETQPLVFPGEPEAGEEKKPETPFSFGSDEIIQE